MENFYNFSGKPKRIKEFYYVGKEDFGDMVKTKMYQAAVYLFSSDGYCYAADSYDTDGRKRCDIMPNDKKPRFRYGNQVHLDLGDLSLYHDISFDEKGNWTKMTWVENNPPEEWVNFGKFHIEIIERQIEYFE